MALTLKADITANDTVFDVNGTDALNPGDLKTIGSETVEIRTANRATAGYLETPYYRVSVNRGSLGTTKAAHAAASALTTTTFGGGGSISVTDGTTTVAAATSLSVPSGSLTDLGSGVAGMAQSVAVQEEVVAFDASSIGSGNGHQLGIVIPAGAYFGLEVIITEVWDQPGGLYIRVGDAAGAQLIKVAQYDPTEVSALPTTYVARSGLPYSGSPATVGNLVGSLPATGYALQECVVFVKFSEDDELATAGSARVVAIIFTPAA